MPYTSNPDLKTISLPFEWKGTPVLDNGRFVNQQYPFNDSLLELLKWQLQTNPQKEEKRKDTWRPEVVSNSNFLQSGQDCIVWLGHASFFIRLAGITLLIDPILFDSTFLKRLCPLPVLPEDFINLDYILISHDHRDHFDEKSIRCLAVNNPAATWLTGLNMEKILYSFSGSKKIQNAGWYQQFETLPELKITYIPSRHWGKRGLNDTNLRLWGGYVIEGADKTIYFCGDSGYDSHFADVAEVFPNIDYCMVGIGAYKPEFFMGQSHTSPADALKAFHDTKARTMIPMHYGTFDLADEPVGDPIRVLRQIKTSDDDIRFLKIGEVLL
ncbi:MBL fold metallo-hydrolase [Dyadobacter psychrotolerans]|uniref:Zn-dependent hydrolase n=1 Tax=Dyadobacter psychrotolerans TaxID=2541721 RepID=A0A4R5DTY2_9BACT|nr:MBL fold metallo-hydrolase [Dyadobacter psychrotolerans]TDE14625.1 Zn-dependent hydrolase [Dyadobacter psychrotolerans]